MVFLFALAKHIQANKQKKIDFDNRRQIENLNFTSRIMHSHSNSSKSNNVSPGSMYIFYIIQLCVNITAFYLAWKCNSSVNPVGRFILAFVCSCVAEFYLLAYFINHIIFKSKCDTG